MNERYYCVIDQQGFYVEFVLVLDDEIKHYTLKDGEKLLEAPPPTMRLDASTGGFLAPKWGEGLWVESATTEEVAAWNQAHPAPESPPSPEVDRNEMLVDHEYRLTLLEIGVI